MKNVYDITNEFERRLAEYTGAPYVVTVDNQSNALFLSLYYEYHINKSITSEYITIPSKTYPSVPCEIIHYKPLPLTYLNINFCFCSCRKMCHHCSRYGSTDYARGFSAHNPTAIASL